MHQLSEATRIVESTLENYKYEFHDLVKRNSENCINHNKIACDFFVDIPSLMNGTWGIYAGLNIDSMPEFKEFDWYEILSIDKSRDPEDSYIPLLDLSYKLGYLWIEKQLSILKSEINGIEIRLYHNGSSEYQVLS
ncbi:hypothetical protein [Motilimonas pumila]|uniref:Uncharacterized protein n=1 Tax=Motilimonas pumila TaxID=2303987 RepID=A0A418YB18_9GAMM|nr:hypothetical protein [Motilimonas pumila]RJG40174.1 hypothetical protein D1Z90_16655 [Motilimonas pumila]